MLLQTRAIVLHRLKYTENNIIVCLYTEAMGRKSYMVKGAQSKKSGVRPALFQPLSLLDIAGYHKSSRELQYIKEAKVEVVFRTIPFDIRKTSIALFISEVLYRCIKEETPNAALFDFIHHSIITLDETESDFENFHLIFLSKLLSRIGIAPHGKSSIPSDYFDIAGGTYCSDMPQHSNFLPPDTARLLKTVLDSDYHPTVDHPKGGRMLVINPTERGLLLNGMLSYLQFHLTGGIKSHQVFHLLNEK